MAFEDADLVAQHQQLGLISGTVAEGCEGEVDQESEAGVEDEGEHGRRLIVAGLEGSPLSSYGLSAPHRVLRCLNLVGGNVRRRKRRDLSRAEDALLRSRAVAPSDRHDRVYILKQGRIRRTETGLD